VRLEVDTKTNLLVIAKISVSALRGVINSVTRWGYIDREGDIKYVSCPRDVAEHLFNDPDLGAPLLEGISYTPFFDKNGRLILTEGFDRDSGIFVRFGGSLRIAPVPDNPTDEDITSAVETIFDPFVDFPFVGAGDGATSWSHLLALILLPFVRDMIKGPVPIFLFQKPTRGTGASLVIETVGRITDGEPPQAQPLASHEEEVRKCILASLISASTKIWFDNIPLGQKVDSPSLAAVTTATTYRDRVLGRSNLAAIPVRCSFIISGNNVELSDELARRTLSVELDTQLPDPTFGRTFKHPNLRAYVVENRSRLVHAALVLIQAWIARGQKPGSEKLASFEAYSEVIGGILQTAGVAGFLGDREGIRERTGDATAPFRLFVQLWWDEFEDEPTKIGALDHFSDPTPGKIRDLVMLYFCHYGEIDLGFSRMHKSAWQSRLGSVISQHVGQVFEIEADEFTTLVCVKKVKTRQGNRYCLELLSPEEDEQPGREPEVQDP